MSALAADHPQGHSHEWEELVRLWEETDAPEGCKVEIIEGIVTVSPAPANQHNSIAWKLQRQLTNVIPEDWGLYQTLAVAIPARSGVYIPDLVVAPETVVDASIEEAVNESENYIQASAASFICEITSKTNARHDRISKPAGYARAGVPLYLLIDRWAPGGPTITLYGEPGDDVYRVLQAGKFGDDIHLPAPFDLVIDTSSFPLR
ncbi:Uma2 family endonuclease [Streptomyces sp. NPDC021100]|uniref:Uma2 family endonuclease n=1 Tax=Streptomyces sp. NPDC021100 TaxID=3365114 RepID=UPI003797A685